MQVIFTKRYMIALNVILFFVKICLQEQFTVIVSALLIVFRKSNWDSGQVPTLSSSRFSQQEIAFILAFN